MYAPLYGLSSSPLKRKNQYQLTFDEIKQEDRKLFRVSINRMNPSLSHGIIDEDYPCILAFILNRLVLEHDVNVVRIMDDNKQSWQNFFALDDLEGLMRSNEYLLNAVIEFEHMEPPNDTHRTILHYKLVDNILYYGACCDICTVRERERLND